MSDLPAELVGGPKDGEVLMIRPGPDGLPMSPLVVAQVQTDPSMMRETEPTEVSAGYLSYTRTLISDSSHRWVYRVDGG